MAFCPENIKPKECADQLWRFRVSHPSRVSLYIVLPRPVVNKSPVLIVEIQHTRHVSHCLAAHTRIVAENEPVQYMLYRMAYAISASLSSSMILINDESLKTF